MPIATPSPDAIVMTSRCGCSMIMLWAFDVLWTNGGKVMQDEMQIDRLTLETNINHLAMIRSINGANDQLINVANDQLISHL